MEKGEHFALLVGMQTGTATVGSSVEIPQKTKIGSAFDPVTPLLEIYLKKPKTLIGKNINATLLIAALLTVARIQKQPECPSVGEWIKQLWDIYTMNHYLA